MTRSRVIVLLQAVVFFLFVALTAEAAESVSPAESPEASGPGQVEPASAEEDGLSGEVLLRQGMELYSAKQFPEAAAVLAKAREVIPDSSAVAFFQGLTQKQMENYDAAADHLRDAVTLTPKIKEALIELIEVLHQTSDPADKEEAWKWLAVAEEQKILPAKTAFLKGLMFLNDNDYERAISSFEDAKNLDPSMVQAAELQIALCYVKDKKVDLARDRLKAVILQDPQSDLAAYARQYQEVVGQAARKVKPWRFTLGVFGQCDSNVLSKPNEPERYYSADPDMLAFDESSINITPTFRIDFIPQFKGPFLFNAQYSASGAWNKRWSTSHDTVTQSASISPGISFGKFALSIVSSYNYSLLKGPGTQAGAKPRLRNYSGQAKFGPLIRVVVGDSALLELFGGYSSTEYFQIATSMMEDRDADSQNAYLSWIWLYKENGFFNLKYEYTNTNAVGAWWSNDAHALSLNMTVPIVGSFVLQFSGSATMQNYNNLVTDFDLIDATAIDKKRRDMVYSGSAGFALGLLRNTKLVVQYSVTHANSTIGRYDYQRRIGSAGVEVRF